MHSTSLRNAEIGAASCSLPPSASGASAPRGEGAAEVPSQGTQA
jgi:hypothetical protein